MKKILVAEDDTFLSKVFEAKLTKEGYEVMVVSDGTLVLENLVSFSPDFILLDIMMPKMNGFEVLEELQRRGVTTPIVVTSNLGQIEDRQKAIALGAKDFLVKSDNGIQQIVERIKQFLS